jgi:CheY-like chemotaxis protein
MDPSEEPQDFPLEPPKKDWPRARGKESVIVAEDSEALRDLMLAMLSGLGYEVLTAGGGHEALRQIERHHGVDLVITDAIMPKGGGFQIMDEVQKKWPQTPILITSGFTEEIEAGLRDRIAEKTAAREGVAAGGASDAPEADEPEGAEDDRPPGERGEASAAEGDDDSDLLVEFLPKPFTPEQLARLVREILDRSKGLVPPRGRA